MKISIVHSFYEERGGEDIMVDLQRAALESAGHEVDLVSVHTADLKDSGLYKVKSAINVVAGTGTDPTEALEKFEPDMVHVHNLFPNLSTRWLSDWTGPLVATLHNFRPMCSNGLLFRDGAECTLCPDSSSVHGVVHGCYRGSRVATLPLAIRNRGGVRKNSLLTRADGLVMLSARAKDMYERAGLEHENSPVIPNFVSKSQTSPRKKIGSPNDPGWIYVGRLSEEKGILDLIRSWPQEKKLEIYGDGPLAERVAVLVRALPQITMRGYVSNSEVLRVLPEASGLIFPSLWAEGMPTVYIEALAAGIPVVARAGNGAADDLSQWQSELVYSQPDGLYPALRRAEASKESLGLLASRRYLTHFTKSVWLSRIEDLYSAAQEMNWRNS